MRHRIERLLHNISNDTMHFDALFTRRIVKCQVGHSILIKVGQHINGDVMEARSQANRTIETTEALFSGLTLLGRPAKIIAGAKGVLAIIDGIVQPDPVIVDTEHVASAVAVKHV